MALIERNLDPSPRQLRQFGLLAAFFAPLAAWLLAGRPTTDWTAWQGVFVGAAAGVGLAAAALALVRPPALRLAFVGLSVATRPIALIVSEIVLAIVYYAIFTPVALVFRLSGRDALQRRLDPSARTYWRNKRRPPDVESYFRQS